MQDDEDTSRIMIFKRLFPFLLAITSVTAQADEMQTDCRMRGMYSNDFFGFSVVIPLDHVACPNSPMGMPEHGLVVELSPDWQSNIEAYGGYNSAAYVNLHDVAEGTWDLLDEELAEKSVTKISESSAHLGKLPAIRVVLRFNAGENKTPMIQDEIAALRPVIPGLSLPSHFYRLTLTTPQDRYNKDLPVFEKVLGSWQELDAYTDANDLPPALQSRLSPSVTPGS